MFSESPHGYVSKENTSTQEVFHGLYKHLQEKLVVLKSCFCNGNHQVVLALNNSSSRSAWLKQALVIVQTNKLTFLMACTWENVTFAPEGKEREGMLGWHFGLMHFYNPCTMKVNFWVQEFLSSCLHSKRNQREVIPRPQSARICWNNGAYGSAKWCPCFSFFLVHRQSEEKGRADGGRLTPVVDC